MATQLHSSKSQGCFLKNWLMFPSSLQMEVGRRSAGDRVTSMPLIVWNDKLSVGVPSIDGEHQRLVGLLNDFYDAVQAGKGKEALGNLLGALIDYTKVHFANEERLFSNSKYPDVAAHKKLHEDLVRQVLELQKKYAGAASVALSLDAVNFLKGWLINHIQGTDKKYSPYLISQGVR